MRPAESTVMPCGSSSPTRTTFALEAVKAFVSSVPLPKSNRSKRVPDSTNNRPAESNATPRGSSIGTVPMIRRSAVSTQRSSFIFGRLATNRLLWTANPLTPTRLLSGKV